MEKLASQGIHVVVAALGDDILMDTMARLRTTYPTIQFRHVAIDLSCPETVLDTVRPMTDDIDIQLLFNNAGYITTGLFVDLDLTRQMKNYHCNATSAVIMTHHFARRMVAKRLPGLVAFTSSSASFIPGPMASIYGSTKAFLTSFAASIGPELAAGRCTWRIMNQNGFIGLRWLYLSYAIISLIAINPLYI